MYVSNLLQMHLILKLMLKSNLYAKNSSHENVVKCVDMGYSPAICQDWHVT